MAIEVRGSAHTEINGVYIRNGLYDGKPMWSHEGGGGGGIDLWFRSWGEWRIGRSNDYYYIVMSHDALAPNEGWVLATEKAHPGMVVVVVVGLGSGLGIQPLLSPPPPPPPPPRTATTLHRSCDKP